MTHKKLIVTEKSLQRRRQRANNPQVYYCDVCKYTHKTRATVIRHLTGRGAPIYIAASQASRNVEQSTHSDNIDTSQSIGEDLQQREQSPNPQYLNRGLDFNFHDPVMSDVDFEPARCTLITTEHATSSAETTIGTITHEHIIAEVWGGGLQLKHPDDSGSESEEEDPSHSGTELGLRNESAESDPETNMDFEEEEMASDEHDSARLTTLSAWDTLNIQFRKDLVSYGGGLPEDQLNIIRAFNFKVETLIKDSDFNKLPLAFPSLPNHGSIFTMRKAAERISGFKAVVYDCCKNSCVCYVGPHEKLHQCPYCDEPRRDTTGRSYSQFHYLPIIPRLLAMYLNPTMARKLKGYRTQHRHCAGQYSDYFDGSKFRRLRNSRIRIGDTFLPRWFFDNERDIALGISFDGFCPFKRRKQTCWPIIMFNYNLPPTERFQKNNILPLGAIPGPKQMKDADSFLYSLVVEGLKLAQGVKAFDADTQEDFVLFAFVVLAFGDIPAVAKMMRMKGVNGFRPCRMCNIHGITIPGSRNHSHYVPLTRPNGDSFDLLNLPMRSAEQFMLQAREVAASPNDAEELRRGTAYGIKGVPVLSHLSSLTFPASFPGDFMHIVWENVVKELILLWCGGWKGINEGSESYEISKSVMEAIGQAGALSGNTIPSSYGCRVPNITQDLWQFTAECWSMWTMLIGPVLLRGRFSKNTYYKHFITLVRLLNLCLQIKITEEELDELKIGFADWVKEFERVYFQDDLSRLQVCTLPIHYLLHIADSIRMCGPVWCYWAYPMERFCGQLLPTITSRKHPFRSIDRRVTELSQLSQIKCLWDLGDTLDLSLNNDLSKKWQQFAPYDCALGFPHAKLKFTSTLLLKIVKFISEKYGVSGATVKSHVNLEEYMECWGKLKIHLGDTIHAVELRKQGNFRDMSYVKCTIATTRTTSRTTYGQLQRLLVITLPSDGPLHIPDSPQKLILAVIKPCKVILRTGIINRYVTDGSFLAEQVIDALAIVGVAARILDPLRNEETFVERPGAHSYIHFDLEDS